METEFNQNNKMKKRNPSFHKISCTRLNLHAHEQPLVAGHVQVISPMVQGGHFEPNPLEALCQLNCISSGHAAINACDDVRAIQGTIAELNECHETKKERSVSLSVGIKHIVMGNLRLLQVPPQHALHVEEDKERSLPAVVGNKGTEARAARVVPDLHPRFGLEAGTLDVHLASAAVRVRELVVWRRCR